jgi:calcium-dependent protein kinase
VQPLQTQEKVSVTRASTKPVVHELRSLLDTPARTIHPVGTSNKLLPGASSPPAAELPLEAQNVLTTHAFHAIKLAEDMMHHSDPLHMRRWFHAAAVYFEVIRSFGGLNPELDAQRQRVRRLSRLCSHLHENCVAEHDAASRQVADVYEIPENRVLGRGSYGTVILAIHRATREEYACKVLCITRVGKQYADKLHAEISSMRQLDHPNVLRLREVFFGQRKMCLVMDLCTGGELFELVNTSIEHRSEGHATRFLSEMLSAVKYLHENGVVHRDLKLENWLFERHAGSHLKLIDFGLARHFLGHERMHGAVGSMYYVAPEVLRGSYDARCDLWSLGVISYMIVSGAPPFWGTDDRDIRQSILAGRWEFPLRFFADVSPMAKDFIARLLSHDPDMRMSASEALSHPWLSASIRTHASNSLEERKRDELLWTLQGFSATNHLQKVVFAVAAFHLTPPNVTEARELFELIDIDRSGTISFAELTQALRVLTRNSEGKPTQQYDEMDESLREIFNAVDISRSSQITFTEFLTATLWRHIQQLDETHVRRVFDTINMYGDNKHLNAASIKLLVGIDYDDDEVDQLIVQADANGDGYLDYADFVRSWHSLIPAWNRQRS